MNLDFNLHFLDTDEEQGLIGNKILYNRKYKTS